jgi:hypothetical protein
MWLWKIAWNILMPDVNSFELYFSLLIHMQSLEVVISEMEVSCIGLFSMEVPFCEWKTAHHFGY